MNNLTQRILSTITLTPLVLFLAFRAPSSWFFGFLVLIILIGLYEFFKLAKTRIGNQIIITIMTVLSSGVILLFTTPSPLVLIPVFLMVVFWLKNIYLVVNYPNTKPSENNFLNSVNAVFLLSPLLLLWVFNSLGYQNWLLLLLLIVWGADSFAYLFGKIFGKHKLAPNLSGGKTIEGVLGGLFGVIILSLIWLFFNDISTQQYYRYILLALITAVFSIFGDLYESIYKREAGVKDSGKILPGHGGILDRIDGLLGAVPIFSIGLTLL